MGTCLIHFYKRLLNSALPYPASSVTLLVIQHSRSTSPATGQTGITLTPPSSCQFSLACLALIVSTSDIPLLVFSSSPRLASSSLVTLLISSLLPAKLLVQLMAAIIL